MTAIEKIRALKFVGNFHGDCDAFNIIHAFVLGKHPMEEKVEALRRWYVEGMCLPEYVSGQESVDEREVMLYVEENSDPS